jgi:hypothetical protein
MMTSRSERVRVRENHQTSRGIMIEDRLTLNFQIAERLKLAHPVFDAWRAFAQRGGSRKLYAQAGYSPRFSETWCLSINIDEADAAEEA